MKNTLFERQKAYQDLADFKLLKKLPVIIKLKGKNFTRLTKNLSKPFSVEFCKIMAESMEYVIKDIQGCVLGYTYSDQVTFVLMNDQTLDTEAWQDNKIQSISTIVTSMFTNAFVKHQLASDLDIIGDPIFAGIVFTTPNVTEAVNNLISQQVVAYKDAVTFAVKDALLAKFGDQDKVNELLNEIPTDGRKKLLLEHCDIDFDDFYPTPYTQGIICCKSPIVNNNSMIKYQWRINWDIPNFAENQDYLNNIITTGKDIFRS